MSDDQNIKNVTRGLGDLIITDAFIRNGVTEEKRRPLTPEQREQVKSLIQDLQAQVQQFLDKQNAPAQAQNQPNTSTGAGTPTLGATVEPAAPAPSGPMTTGQPTRKRKRLGLRKR